MSRLYLAQRRLKTFWLNGKVGITIRLDIKGTIFHDEL